MSTRETAPNTTGFPMVVASMKSYFDGLITQNLAELYGVSTPDELAGLDVKDFEVIQGDEAAEDSLTKVWFSAHARGLIQSGGYNFNGSDVSQQAILYNHARLRMLERPRFFKIVPGARDQNPYNKVLSRLRTKDGDMVARPRGTEHAARILVGEVVLTDPDYDATHPEAEFRKLVAASFLK